jgi:hypothetical protein
MRVKELSGYEAFRLGIRREFAEFRAEPCGTVGGAAVLLRFVR